MREGSSPAPHRVEFPAIGAEMGCGPNAMILAQEI